MNNLSVLGKSIIFKIFPELTHEFLQILEKTPSRLKRIRNWKVKAMFLYLFSSHLLDSAKSLKIFYKILLF